MDGIQEDPVRDGEQYGDEPHRAAARLDDPRGSAREHRRGMNNGQIAVQADAGQQEDATVEVYL